MNRLEPLFQSSQISVSRFDHPKDCLHHDPEEEVSQNYAISFVEAGSFQLTTQKKRWVLSPKTAFISHPGAVYRCRHQENMPSDVCLCVVYSRQFLEETYRDDHLLPFRAPAVIWLTNQLAFLKFRLVKLARATDTLALESWACELVSALLDGSSNSEKLYRARQLSWYAERVEAIRALLEASYAEQHSLASLSKAVAMSPFQFARVFRELTGLPPHRYLLRVRLERASKMIEEGKSVTETCFDVGFSNLSHFTRSFRRRFGHAPSLHKPRRVAGGTPWMVKSSESKT
jgi:AraC family transcriptional regulator